MICKNCTKWHKVGQGTVKNKTEQGYCDFMNSRIHTVWENDEPIRDKNNKSLVINNASEICGKIGDLEINATTYGFKSNNKNFFATGFGLLEKNQTDEFLLNATKQQTK